MKERQGLVQRMVLLKYSTNGTLIGYNVVILIICTKIGK